MAQRSKARQTVPLVMNRAQMSYVSYLYRTGLYGTTLYETHQQVFCAGLRALMPPEIVRSILAELNGEPANER
jgi:hypothetical protein